MAKEKLIGLVAAILNNREVVINLGHEKGVEVGMKFKILDQTRQVKDPATGEELGEVRREKVQVKVVEVKPKLCIARTYETYRVNEGGSGYGLLPSFLRSMQEPKIVTRVRTLRFDDSGLDYEPLNETESFVKVGDPVELIEDDTGR